jgi:hypothetical protein
MVALICRRPVNIDVRRKRTQLSGDGRPGGHRRRNAVQMALRHRRAMTRQEDWTTGPWLRAAELALEWRAHFFAPDFFASLNFAPRSFASSASINSLRSRHFRLSRSDFLLTVGRRLSGTVSEILNVAPLRSLSTAVRHPFKVPNPGIASKPPTSPRTERHPGVPVACPRCVLERMLAKFRLAGYDDRSPAGRGSPTGGGPQPPRNDKPSDAAEAVATSSTMEQSPARPR